MKQPLKIMTISGIRDTKATISSSKRRICSKVVSLQGGFYGGGKIYSTKAEAEQAARH